MAVTQTCYCLLIHLETRQGTVYCTRNTRRPSAFNSSSSLFILQVRIGRLLRVLPLILSRFAMATISPTPVVIDGKGHLLGRLASIISKQILSGQKIVVVRCEEINISGSFFRNKVCRVCSHLPDADSHSSIIQASLPQLPSQTPHCQPEKIRPFSSPRSFQNSVPCYQRHGAPQDFPRYRSS